MRKLKLLLSGFALLGGVVSVQSQEWTGDITNADGLAFTKQYVGMSDGDVAETWKTLAKKHGIHVSEQKRISPAFKLSELQAMKDTIQNRS